MVVAATDIFQRAFYLEALSGGIGILGNIFFLHQNIVKSLRKIGQVYFGN